MVKAALKEPVTNADFSVLIAGSPHNGLLSAELACDARGLTQHIFSMHLKNNHQPPELPLVKLWLILFFSLVSIKRTKNIRTRKFYGKILCMRFNYNGLWKLLIDKGLKKKDLINKVGVAPSTIAKMGNGKPVSLDVLGRISSFLGCDIGNLVSLDRSDKK